MHPTENTPAGASSTTPPPRELIARPVDALGRAVRRAPRLVLSVTVALTVLLLAAGSQAEDAPPGAGMMPDVPEAAASETISDRFGDDGEEVLQLVVRSRESGLVGADGYATAATIEAALRDSAAADHLADRNDRPGILTWLFPAQQALAGTDPGPIDDAAVLETYSGAVAEMPADHADMAAALLPADTDPASADRALAMVFVDTRALAPDTDGYHDRLVDVHTELAAAVTDAELPAGVTVEPFNPDLLFADADEAFGAEIARLFGSAFLIIVVILAFVYWVRPGAGMSAVRSGRRSLADMLLTMAATVMAILWMTGLAVVLGPGYLDVVGPMNDFTQVIPILLIGLGVDYAIHLTSRYREELGAGASVREAVGGAVGSVGGALVLATLTTAIGFLTNLVNPIPALRDFGVLSAVGIVSAFVLMLTFVPAARLLLDRRAERAGRLPTAALGRTSQRVLPRVMGRTAVLAEKAPVPTLAVTVVLAGLGLFGMTQLETRFSNTDFVPDDSPALETLDTLADDFDGGYAEATDVLVTGPVTDAAVHNALVGAHQALVEADDVALHGGQAGVTSPVTLLGHLLAPGPDGGAAPAQLAEVAAATGVAEDLTVPDGADVGPLYRELLAADAETAGTVLAHDASGDVEVVRLQLATNVDEEQVSALMAALDEAFAPVEAAGAEVVATSPGIQNQVVVDAVQDSQASSLAITLFVAMLLLVAVFAYERRRPALGVLTTVPVVLVVLWTFGMMAATDIPFGPITATIAALAIGIGLPYAIHVTHRFIEDRARHADAATAIRATVRHAGGAMAGSAFTTMAGFGILVTSSLVPFRQLGAVTVYAVGFSLLAATLVLPSLLVLWDRWHHRGQRRTVVPAAEPEERVLVDI